MVFVLVGSLVYGQVRIGPKVGATMATMPAAVENMVHPEFMWWDLDYLETFDPGYIPGFQVGLMVEIPILDFFALQPEILYSAKGFTQDVTDMYFEPGYGDPDDKYIFQMKNYYVEVPVLGKFIYNTGGTEVALLAGPYFGYATNGSFREVGTWTYENSEGDEYTEKEWYGYRICYGNKDYNDYVHRYDVGATVGAGVRIPIGCENSVLFDFRYNHGFIDYNNWNNLEDVLEMIKPEDYTALTNRNFSFTMGYTFAVN